MQDQPRYDPYEESGVFPDGKVLQTPPAGTVPRDGAPPPGAQDPGEMVSIPIALDMALLERGRERFDIYCAVCHGYQADGVSLVATAMSMRRPPPLNVPPIRDYSPGRIYRVARSGYGLMPSYAEELSERDTWAVVAYLMALRLRQDVILDSLPPALREDVRRSLASATAESVEGAER